MKTLLVDANVILRFLRDDHPTLSPKAKRIFLEAQKGTYTLYLDEVVVAEVIWVLFSFYEVKREAIADCLEQLIGQSWIINPKKSLLLQALSFYRTTSLDYIDCWLLVVNKKLKTTLTTFDTALEKANK